MSPLGHKIGPVNSQSQCGTSLLPAELLAVVMQMTLVNYGGPQNKTSKQKVVSMCKGLVGRRGLAGVGERYERLMTVVGTYYIHV